MKKNENQFRLPKHNYFSQLTQNIYQWNVFFVFSNTSEMFNQHQVVPNEMFHSELNI